MDIKRTNRQIKKNLMVINTKVEIINIIQIENRRFMFNPQNGILILGEEQFGKNNINKSHAEEFYSSKVEGCFDDYLRGWIGVGGNYPYGVVHFAPEINLEQFDKGFDMLQMLSHLNGVNCDTIIRGFYNVYEEKIASLMPFSFNRKSTKFNNIN